MDLYAQNNTLREYLFEGLIRMGLNLRELLDAAGNTAIASMCHTPDVIRRWHDHGELIVVPDLPLAEGLSGRCADYEWHGIAVQIGGTVIGSIGPKRWRKGHGQSVDPFSGIRNLSTIADYLNAIKKKPAGEIQAVAEFRAKLHWDGEFRVFVPKAAAAGFVEPYFAEANAEGYAEQIACAAIVQLQAQRRRTEKEKTS